MKSESDALDAVSSLDLFSILVRASLLPLFVHALLLKQGSS